MSDQNNAPVDDPEVPAAADADDAALAEAPQAEDAPEAADDLVDADDLDDDEFDDDEFDDGIDLDTLTELPVAEVAPSINDIVVGQVARLVDFGAFVDVSAGPAGGTVTGLVHVSEVDTGFVENIYAHLAEGQMVLVKVLSMGDDGKIGLSIKQADPEWEDMADLDRPRRSTIDKDFDRRLRKFMHNSQSIQGEARRQRRSRLGRER